MPTRFIRADILAQTAYPKSDIPNHFILLDSAAPPLSLPEDMRRQWADALAEAPLDRTSNTAENEVQAALRAALPIPENAQIVLGNGAEELVRLLAWLTAQPDAAVLALEPSSGMYRCATELCRMTYTGIALNDDFSPNLTALFAAIEQKQPALLFISHPNRATGTPIARADLEEIARRAEGIVVVDETCAADDEHSFIAQAGQPENLVVLRSFDSIGLCGIRTGYAVGSPLVMNELAKLLPPRPVNGLSLCAARFALQHADTFRQNTEQLAAERTRVAAALAELAETQVLDGQAHFLTVRLPDAPSAFERLKDNGILVKNLHGRHALLHNCLRLGIGTPEQNDGVVQGVQQAVAEYLARKNGGGYCSTDLSQKLFYATLCYVAALSLLSLWIGLAFGHI